LVVELYQDGFMIESYLNTSPSIDPLAWIHQAATIIGDVQVGPQSSIWPHTTLRGDDGAIRIGARTSIQDGTVIHSTESLSSVTIGDQVTVGHNAIIHGANVGHNSLIGMGAILLDNVTIGDWCLIGAGTLVTQGINIPSHSLVVGSPGRVVRELKQKERDWITYSWKRYVAQCDIYRNRDAQ
jgi:carbonic anhydrase/acetyltransferase-like protein (isoleucine patch superfamily)